MAGACVCVGGAQPFRCSTASFHPTRFFIYIEGTSVRACLCALLPDPPPRRATLTDHPCAVVGIRRLHKKSGNRPVKR